MFRGGVAIEQVDQYIASYAEKSRQPKKRPSRVDLAETNDWDDCHSPLKPKEYIKFRLVPMMQFCKELRSCALTHSCNCLP